MEGPRRAKRKELPLVEALANKVFRDKEGQPQTMFQEYPDLYHPDNIDNIYIITDKGIPVSNVNFLPQTVTIFGTDIPIATLGGVCTDPAYRGQGLAGSLLKECILRMEKLDIDVLHISGDRDMYRAAGSLPAGVLHHFGIDPAKAAELKNDKLFLSEYTEDDLDEVAQLYQKEGVRFLRPYERFRMNLASRKFMHKTGIVRKNLLIQEDGRLVAYLIITFEGTGAEIHDCAGTVQMITGAAEQVMKTYGLNKLNGYVMAHDGIGIDYCARSGVELKQRRYHGTIKIVNFTRFMDALRPYFSERFDKSFLEKIYFEEDEKGARFLYKDTDCIISDKGKLNDLIFGGQDPIPAGICEDLEVFFRTVFPIPYVNTGNLSDV